jgi:HNH endonuclease
MCSAVTETFWDMVEPTGFCWNWMGAKTSRGYGQKQWEGRVQNAHRVSYELLVGPVETGLVIDHLCRNHSCVNPDHLDPVTQKENLTRRPQELKPLGRKLEPVDNCKRGHLFDDANTYLYHGRRYCRQCRKEARA